MAFAKKKPASSGAVDFFRFPPDAAGYASNGAAIRAKLAQR
jgi:hypothetical protein